MTLSAVWWICWLREILVAGSYSNCKRITKGNPDLYETVRVSTCSNFFNTCNTFSNIVHAFSCDFQSFEHLRSLNLGTKSTALSAAIMAWWTSRSRALLCEALNTLLYIKNVCHHNDHQWSFRFHVGASSVSYFSEIYAFNIFQSVHQRVAFTRTAVHSCSIGWSFSLLRTIF